MGEKSERNNATSELGSDFGSSDLGLVCLGGSFTAFTLGNDSAFDSGIRIGSSFVSGSSSEQEAFVCMDNCFGVVIDWLESAGKLLGFDSSA